MSGNKRTQESNTNDNAHINECKRCKEEEILFAPTTISLEDLHVELIDMICCDSVIDCETYRAMALVNKHFYNVLTSHNNPYTEKLASLSIKVGTHLVCPSCVRKLLAILKTKKYINTNKRNEVIANWPLDIQEHVNTCHGSAEKVLTLQMESKYPSFYNDVIKNFRNAIANNTHIIFDFWQDAPYRLELAVCTPLKCLGINDPVTITIEGNWTQVFADFSDTDGLEDEIQMLTEMVCVHFIHQGIAFEEFEKGEKYQTGLKELVRKFEHLISGEMAKVFFESGDSFKSENYSTLHEVHQKIIKLLFGLIYTPLYYTHDRPQEIEEISFCDGTSDRDIDSVDKEVVAIFPPGDIHLNNVAEKMYDVTHRVQDEEDDSDVDDEDDDTSDDDSSDDNDDDHDTVGRLTMGYMFSLLF